MLEIVAEFDNDKADEDTDNDATATSDDDKHLDERDQLDDELDVDDEDMEHDERVGASTWAAALFALLLAFFLDLDSFAGGGSCWDVAEPDNGCC